MDLPSNKPSSHVPRVKQMTTSFGAGWLRMAQWDLFAEVIFYHQSMGISNVLPIYHVYDIYIYVYIYIFYTYVYVYVYVYMSMSM